MDTSEILKEWEEISAQQESLNYEKNYFLDELHGNAGYPGYHLRLSKKDEEYLSAIDEKLSLLEDNFIEKFGLQDKFNNPESFLDRYLGSDVLFLNRDIKVFYKKENESKHGFFILSLEKI